MVGGVYDSAETELASLPVSLSPCLPVCFLVYIKHPHMT